jgi:hypothetical protein
MELSGPGVQYIADNQLYNSIITAHAILMIFFMVEKKYIFNFKLLSSYISFSFDIESEDKENLGEINDNNGNTMVIGNNNKYDNNNNNNKNSNNYIKILVNDPFNNRDIIAKVAKNQKGVYIWKSLDGNNMYVGHSTSLASWITSYFMPSILKTKARRVLRYLNKHGFSNMNLTIYIMDEKSSLEQVVALEQEFIDSLKPNLNVDLVASSSLMPILYILLWLFILCFLSAAPENFLLLDITNSFLFTASPQLDCDITSFSMFFCTCKLFNKSSKKGKINVSNTPLVIYSYDDKELAIKENRGKSGVYRWVNTLTGDTYVGSAVSLSKRFSVYYSIKSVNEVLSRSKSNILSALLKYGYSAFRLEILEYCEGSQTIVREQYYLDQLLPEYNILSVASSSLGKLHTEEVKLRISNSLKGRNHSEETRKKNEYFSYR